jgi:multisite-specific tRNA:(cytosine-C5)-methyltransferase
LPFSAGNKELDHPTQVNESTIAIGCWKGRASLTVMVTAIDCQELLGTLLMRKESESEPEPEPENSSLVLEEKSYVEADKVQDSNDIEKNEHVESTELPTSS